MSKLNLSKDNLRVLIQIQIVAGFGVLSDYYPEHEHTEDRRKAWAQSDREFEKALEALDHAVLTENEQAADEAIEMARRIEKRWGDSPTSNRLAELIGAAFAEG